MRVLVTGGAGFIGSTFVHHLAEHRPAYDVIVLDALTYAGNPANLAGLPRVTLVHGDIGDEPLVDQLMEGIDAVVHLAAESHVTRSEQAPGTFRRTNVEGTRVLLEAACRRDVGRFLHVSTDEVYGEAPQGGRFTEGDKELGHHQATSAYAKSKSAADDLVASYRDRLALNIVRPTNNFGPRQHPEKAFPRWVTRVLRGQPITLWGIGAQVRDWLYAPDTAGALDLVLHEAPSGEIFNVGADNEPEIANRDLAHWLLGRLAEHGARIEHQVDPRRSHDFRYRVDSTKLRALGWRPTGDVWASLDATCRWYEDNRWWWEPLVAEAERIYA